MINVKEIANIRTDNIAFNHYIFNHGAIDYRIFSDGDLWDLIKYKDDNLYIGEDEDYQWLYHYLKYLESLNVKY